MAYSYVVYTGNGSTTQFAITFPYIRKEHVKVYINYVDTAYTYVNDTTVLLASAPANGARVEVRRVTPANSPLVDFVDGSTLVAADLDTSNLQHLYLEQELDDAFEQTISIDPSTGLPTAGGQRITNVGTPTAGADATTKNYVDAADALKLNKAGDTMTGALAMGNNKITGLADPTSAQDAATKNWAETAGTSFINQCASLLDQFDDRYLGSKSTPPTVDNDGNALITGALYWDNVNNVMRVYTGSAWQNTGGTIGLIARQSYTATAGQVNFNYTAGYDSGFVDAYVNGSKLLRTSGYTIDTTNSRIVLTVGATAGDKVEVIAYGGIASVQQNVTDAAASAAAAATSSSTAAGYASSAGTNATAAAASATTAGIHATTATTQASNAQSSASSAATSAGNAATSASSAAGSASSAQAQANNAANSATSAAQSATNAGTSATAAANSATAASTSATNAANSAAAASTSATNASGSATAASTSATNAATSASAASTSATNAATSASNALNSATAASSLVSTITNLSYLFDWGLITQAAGSPTDYGAL